MIARNHARMLQKPVINRMIFVQSLVATRPFKTSYFLLVQGLWEDTFLWFFLVPALTSAVIMACSAAEFVRVRWADIEDDSDDTFCPRLSAIARDLHQRCDAIHARAREAFQLPDKKLPPLAQSPEQARAPARSKRSGVWQHRKYDFRVLLGDYGKQGLFASWGHCVLVLLFWYQQCHCTKTLRPAKRLRVMLQRLHNTFAEGHKLAVQFLNPDTKVNEEILCITSVLFDQLLPCGFGLVPGSFTNEMLLFCGGYQYAVERVYFDVLPVVCIDSYGFVRMD